jgi:hypothetical protein
MQIPRLKVEQKRELGSTSRFKPAGVAAKDPELREAPPVFA